MTSAPSPSATEPPRPRWRKYVRPIVVVLISLLVGRIIISLVGSVDWGKVAAALGQVSWMALPLLVVLLLVRQAFNAVPLSRFVEGLGWWRSAQNDVTAALIGTVSPPPGDVVIRVAMFRSWGLNPVDGMAGVTLNMLTFYVIRFAVPSIGLLILIREEVSSGRVVLAMVSLLVAVVIIITLVLVSRGERLAALVGYSAGRVVARFRADTDPAQWSESVLDFRERMSTRLTGGLPTSLAALAFMVLADALILLTALRAVGVPVEALPLVWVIGAFLIAYPLTALPLAGLGVLDAALIVVFVDVAGEVYESTVVAAFIVWRVVTILGPLLLGLLSLAAWKWNRNDHEGAEPA